MKTLRSILQLTRKDAWPLAVLFLVVVFAFWDVPRTFYQQDEWQILGNNFAQGWGNLVHYSSPTELLLGGGRPLIRLVDLYFFGFLKYTVVQLGILAILVHAVVVGQVYAIVKRLSGDNRVIAFVSSLFFAVNAVSQGAVSWVAAFGTLVATVLILASVLTYLEFLKGGKLKMLLITGALIYLSLLFKEIGIFLVIMYPILYVLETKQLTLKKFVVGNSIFLGAGLLAVFFRLAEYFFSTSKVAGLAAGGSAFPATIAIRLILYPITSFFQPLVPSAPMFQFSRWFSELQYPYLKTSSNGQLVSETAVTDMLCLAGSLLVIWLAFYLVGRARRAGEESRHIVFALLFGVLSLMPYALVDRGSSYLDSRYYYLTSIGIAILVGTFFELLYRRRAAAPVAVLLLALLAGNHLLNTRQEIANQVVLGDERQAILKTIKQAVPSFGGQAVFYLTGDKDYYVANNKVPLQEGVGNTLLIWYYHEGPVPKSYLNDNVLWDLGDQGYYQRPGLSFGYYADYAKLKEDQQKYGFPVSAVHAFSWDSKASKLTDITQSTRDSLSGISN